MFCITRRFFTTGAVTEVEKVATELATKLHKEFAEQCATVMKVRGHRKLQMGTVKTKNGNELSFDFSYGWPVKYYCKVNTSVETVSKEAITKFEKDIMSVGVMPNRGVYFSKGAFEGNAADLRCLFVDAKMLQTMTNQKVERLIRSNKVIFFCVVSLTYLSWTFFSDKNPQRRRLIERFQRYVVKDKFQNPSPLVEEQFISEHIEGDVVEEIPTEVVVEVEETLPTDVNVESEVYVEETSTDIVNNPNQVSGVWNYISSTFWWMLGYK